MDRKVFTLFSFVEQMQPKYIERLRTFVSIPSISEQQDHRLDVVKALRWIAYKLKKIGADVRFRRIGKEIIYTGDHIPLTATDELELPDVVVGSLGSDVTKRTLLIYGHVDVKPVHESEHWSHDPFDMQVRGEYLCGRGVTDDKGPLLGWINAIEAFQKTKIQLPINFKFVIEGMEEVGSEGLHELLNELSLSFFKNVDHVAISDNYWLGQNKPCLTYGLRGVIYFYITVEGSDRVLHSGCHGGAVAEPLSDLISLLAALNDSQGRPMVPDIYEDIEEIDSEEIARFSRLDFQPQVYKANIAAPGLQSYDKVDLLRRRWCLPSISIHGIEHSFDKPGAPTLICKKVMGKFSVRVVPAQPPKKVAQKVKNYLEQLHKLRGSPNKLDIKIFRDGRPFLSDHTTVNYQAASRAIIRVWQQEPDLTRDGAAMPVAIALEESTRKDVVLIPMGQSLDFQHEGNERLAIRNYLNGIKVFAMYFFELAAAEREDSEEEAARQNKREKWRLKMV
ncbi:Cytosolic non-specific dipeptidase [Fasciola hepatica]|uniref:Cytosolic non-specific dipeptidase n=1 Tax=Fasciola hepatica TaxID=6192 RepID=A0A4E0RED9_FASHE|nr:Cytosolic non-specific dipeptidase [Fasciola hepatica]